MQFNIRPASRKKAKLRIGISGPSGSGKTYSALKLARGMASSWDKVGIIDTEQGSADLYAHLGDYKVLTINNFSPVTYAEAIEAMENAGVEVIIVDSVTHEWKYVLERVEELAKNSKNSYTAWAKATPFHEKFVQAILQSKCHVITTVRSKQDYDMSKDSAGKTIIQKVGMKQETREGFEYELTIGFDINMNHVATVSKDRTSIFSEVLPFTISEETGKMILDWNNTGENITNPIISNENNTNKTESATDSGNSSTAGTDNQEEVS